MKRITPILFSLALVTLSAWMHWNCFNRDLTGFHVWRQTQTQSTLLSFYEEDMNILNPKRNERGNGDGIFRMEFPLMQWIGAALYKVWGPDILWIRIYMFLTGLCSVLGIFKLTRLLFNNPFTAYAAAWSFNFSPVIYYYTIVPMPDNLALCLAIWGVYFFVLYTQQKKMYSLWISSFLIAVATLCKLPFILFYSASLAFVLFRVLADRSISASTKLIVPILISIILPLSWYVWVIPGWHNTEVSKGMLVNTESLLTILDYLQGNLISTLPELLVNYAAFPLFVIGCIRVYRYPLKANPLSKSMVLLGASIIGYFLFEINMIGIMHDYYLFPFLPLLFLMVAAGFDSMYARGRFYRVAAVVLITCTPFTAHVRITNRWSTESVGFNRDLLDYKSELQNLVPDSALCLVGNDESHFIYFYYIHKKGWGYQDDDLSVEYMQRCMKEGARYWYNDSRLLETPEILALTENLIAQFGSIRVYKLKSNPSPIFSE